MNARFRRITLFLWFSDQAQEAANFYISIFDNSRVLSISRYHKKSVRVSGRPEGSMMTVAFQLDGHDFTALNGGPIFTFNEAVSLVIHCHSQQEVNHYRNQMSTFFDEKAPQCGWLKDRYGVSWQVVPTQLIEFLNHPDPIKAGISSHPDRLVVWTYGRPSQTRQARAIRGSCCLPSCPISLTRPPP